MNARNTSEKETTCSDQLEMKIVLVVLRLVRMVKGVEPGHASLYRYPIVILRVCSVA